MKVTPAHDPNDYACGLRHKLPMINILNPDGTINANGGPYAGLDRYKARERVTEDMEKLGLFEGREDRDIELTHSDRSKTPIEPYLSDQWFVKMDDLAQTAIDAVQRRPRAVLPGALRQDLSRLARREARLVHQPAAVVGPSHPDLVRALPRGRAEAGLRRPRRRGLAARRGERPVAGLRPGRSAGRRPGTEVSAGAGSRRARHLVQLGPLAALDARLAGADAGAGATTIRPACW